MLKFSTGSASKKVTAVTQMLDVLAKAKKRYRRYFGYSGYELRRQASPALIIGTENVTFEFEIPEPFDDELYDTKVEFFPLSLAKDSKDLANLQPSSKVLRLGTRCSCDDELNTGELCEHAVAAINYLHAQLSAVSTENVLAWMQQCRIDGESIGEQLIEDVRRLFNQTVDSDEYRLSWRLAPSESRRNDDLPVEIVCYLQKKKRKSSGWTSGRKVRSILDSAPSCAFRHASDRILAILCETSHNGYGYDDGCELLEMLELLRDNPDLCWDIEGLPKATLERRVPTVELVEQDGKFLPQLVLDGLVINQRLSLLPAGKDTYVGLFAELEKLRVSYFTLSAEQVGCVQRIQRAQTRGVQLTSVSAERFTQALSGSDTRKSLPTRLPDSLAGPKVPLPAIVELHLLPTGVGGLEARLRVACSALEEAPVPGMVPECLQVQTPAGPIQLVRELSEEAAIANRYADALQMGDFDFSGPYTWLTQDLETSLRLIERTRQLGEQGPTVCWPASKPMRLLGDITPQSMKIRLTSERDWFGVEGELSIEGLAIPLAELFTALRGGARFVPLGEGQFATISNELRQRLATIDDLAFPERSKMTVPRAAAGLIEKALGDDIPVEVDLRWRKAIERLNDQTKIPKRAPKALRAKLRDYQLAGYQWLSQLSHWGLGGCLADDMGLGKTVQALGVLLDRASLGPALIIAPTSVGINWMRETQKFAPSLAPHLYREHDRDHLVSSAAAGQLVIASYQMLQRDIQRFASRKWATLVLDESQFIKNFNTKTNQAVRELDFDWCVALSGTPLENHLGELWSLMRVISPGLLGSWERFRSRFGEPIERGKDHERLKALSHVVRPFILRRTKGEVLTELPPRTEILLTAELSPAERKHYDAARLAALADLTASNKDANDQQKRIRVLSWLTRLRQLACHVRLVDQRWKKSSAKLDLFMETVSELVENKHRALVFSQFVQHLAIVRETLDQAGIRYQYLDGSTTLNKRQEAVDAFQNGDGDLFLISLKAGGTGLNLTAADYVLHLDPWWNPAVEDQATDRAHRIGQSQKVTVYRLVAKDTIEEQILAMHADKRELVAGVLDGADRAGKMSTQELVDLIRVSTLPDES